MGNYSKAKLIEFLAYVREKGLANASTAQGWQVAVAKLLEDVSSGEEADVRTVDLNSATVKFNNRNSGKLTPTSLAEYSRRARVAIEEFVTFTNNPAGYKPKSGRAPKADSAKPAKTKKDAKPTLPPVSPMLALPPGPLPAKGIAHVFPLRDDFLAQLNLPIDLRSEEARRLGAFIQALARDFAPSQ